VRFHGVVPRSLLAKDGISRPPSHCVCAFKSVDLVASTVKNLSRPFALRKFRWLDALNIHGADGGAFFALNVPCQRASNTLDRQAHEHQAPQRAHIAPYLAAHSSSSLSVIRISQPCYTWSTSTGIPIAARIFRELCKLAAHSDNQNA